MPILRSLFGLRPAASRATLPRRSRPRLEVLEDRCLLSTLAVTSSADDITQQGTLRYAVAHAANRDTISISPALTNTPVVLTQGELLLNKDLTIQAAANAPATISGKPSTFFNGTRVFEIASNAQVTLSYLTITGGSLSAIIGGAGIYNQGTLTLTHSTVSGNQIAGGIGGGVYNSGTLTLTHSSVSGNNAVDGGASGIHNERGTLIVNNSTISKNSGEYVSGGIYGGIITINNSTVSDNDGWVGGAIYGGTVTINNSILSGNFANQGGAIAFANVTINNSILSNNKTRAALSESLFGNGGAIYGSGTFTNCIFSGNSADSNGGAIWGGGTITNSTLSNNSAGHFGGGIYIASGTLTVKNSHLSGNSAEFGGSIANGGSMSFSGVIDNGGAITITNCVLSGNSASNAGGGIYNYSGTLMVTNSTIKKNTSPAGADVFLAGGALNEKNSAIGVIGP